MSIQTPSANLDYHVVVRVTGDGRPLDGFEERLLSAASQRLAERLKSGHRDDGVTVEPVAKSRKRPREVETEGSGGGEESELERRLEKRFKAFEEKLGLEKKGREAAEARSSAADKRSFAAEERISVAEKRSSMAEKRMLAAEERISVAEKRSSAAEKRMLAAEERISVAEERTNALREEGETTKAKIAGLQKDVSVYIALGLTEWLYTIVHL